MTEEGLRVIDHAIWYWTEKLNGKVFWWDKSPEPTKKWCKEQINYFNEYRKNYIKNK